MADGVSFYRWFNEQRLTRFGSDRRRRIEQSRLALLMRHITPPGRMLELGPGHGAIARSATDAGWSYTAVEASPALAEQLRRDGYDVAQAWVPPFPAPDVSCQVVYADQVLEHMAGIDQARAFVAEAWRVLSPGGVLFVVVPDYMKERAFFWDIDYTHNFITTERRVRQLLYDGGFDLAHVERRIGMAGGLTRDLLGAAAVVLGLPGTDALSRYTRTEDLLFRLRKNLFQTLTFVARKPA